MNAPVSLCSHLQRRRGRGLRASHAISWEPLPGDVTYRVEVLIEDYADVFTFPYPETTAETSITASEDLPSGTHQWSVIAFEAGEAGDPERLGASRSRQVTVDVP